MLAVLKQTAAPGVTITDIPAPHPAEDEVLIKVRYASICGTDIGIYDWIPWAQGHITPPVVIGHEVVGEIVEINTNKETSLKKGDLVSSETHIFCGNCSQCKVGNYHICENMVLFGIGRNGGFAEFATIPIRTTWANNKSIPIEAMSVQEPLGNAVHVVTKADVKGKKVLVVGLGPTGLCAGMAAKPYGAAEVVGIDPSTYRRNLAQSVGFDRVVDVINPQEYGTFDVVCEMSGHQDGIVTGLNAARIAGLIMAFGIPKKEVLLDWGQYFINKELTLKSVFGRKIWDTWKETTALLVDKKVDLQKTITHRFALKDFEEAMTVMKSGECGKILLEVG